MILVYAHSSNVTHRQKLNENEWAGSESETHRADRSRGRTRGSAHAALGVQVLERAVLVHALACTARAHTHSKTYEHIHSYIQYECMYNYMDSLKVTNTSYLWSIKSGSIMINQEANNRSSILVCESGRIGAGIHNRRPLCINLEANACTQLVVQIAKTCKLVNKYTKRNGI